MKRHRKGSEAGQIEHHVKQPASLVDPRHIERRAKAQQHQRGNDIFGQQNARQRGAGGRRVASGFSGYL